MSKKETGFWKLRRHDTSFNFERLYARIILKAVTQIKMRFKFFVPYQGEGTTDEL